MKHDWVNSQAFAQSWICEPKIELSLTITVSLPAVEHPHAPPAIANATSLGEFSSVDPILDL